MKKSFTGLLFFVVGAFIGGSIAQNSWDGMVYFYSDAGESRQPAAINNVFDFSNLRGSALSDASKKRLIADAKIHSEYDSIGVELGHFVLSKENGSKQYACEAYEKVSLVFHAENVSISGSPSVMIVNGPCAVGDKLDRVATIWIPTEKILKESIGDIELKYLDDEKVSLAFENMGSEWPKKWRLQSARLYNSNSSSADVNINQSELRAMLNKPFVINW